MTTIDTQELHIAYRDTLTDGKSCWSGERIWGIPAESAGLPLVIEFFILFFLPLWTTTRGSSVDPLVGVEGMGIANLAPPRAAAIRFWRLQPPGPCISGGLTATPPNLGACLARIQSCLQRGGETSQTQQSGPFLIATSVREKARIMGHHGHDQQDPSSLETKL